MCDLPTSYQELIAGGWYAGANPSYSESDTNEALDALRASWPERLRSLAQDSARGPAIVVPVIQDGLIIARCREVPGFSSVLDRWRGGERSAQAEASIGATFLSHDLPIQFDVELGGKRLDLRLNVPSGGTFVEVVTPETAQVVKDAVDLIKKIGNAVVDAMSNVHTDILLDSDFSIDRLPRLLEEVTALPGLHTETRIPDLGIIRKREATLPVSAGAQLSRPSGRRPIYWVSQLQAVEGEITSATIGLSISDDRAKRFLSGELHHFSRDHPNLLVIETSAVAGGTKAWRERLTPRLTPQQNRRVGAILFFHQQLSESPLRARKSFALLRNTHACVPIPEGVLAVLAAIADDG